MELLVAVVNGFCPWTVVTKSSILDVAGFLDPPLHCSLLWSFFGIREKKSKQNISPFEALTDFPKLVFENFQNSTIYVR